LNLKTPFAVFKEKENRRKVTGGRIALKENKQNEDLRKGNRK